MTRPSATGRPAGGAGHRPPRIGVALAGAGFAGLLGAALPAHAADAQFCHDPALNSLVNKAARDELDSGQLATLWRRFNPDDASTPLPQCGNTVAYCVGQKMAIDAVARAYALLGQSPPDIVGARATLVDGRKYGDTWQLLVGLGDVEAALARQQNKPEFYRDAASDLQFAINGIKAAPLCPEFGEVRPDEDEVRRIRKRTQEAVLLSPRFDIARTKQGDCGGIFLDVVKGIDAEAVPVPITFASGSADFTPEGQKAAGSLLQCLVEKKLPAIVLTGHTDEHGTDAYNMTLSARRLAMVGAYLKAGGYTGAIRTIPKGKREPFKPDDPAQHPADEIDQMNRRVELREVAP